MAIPSWAIGLFGVVLIISGLRAIRKGYVYTDVGEYQGGSAVRWGVVWIILGGLFILAAVFDIQWFNSAVHFFFSG